MLTEGIHLSSDLSDSYVEKEKEFKNIDFDTFKNSFNGIKHENLIGLSLTSETEYWMNKVSEVLNNKNIKTKDDALKLLTSN